jgi:hypothetical protein
MLEKLGHQLELLVHTAEAVEDHRFDGMARGHNAELRVWLGGVVNDLPNAEFFKHTCDEAPMVQDVATVDGLSVHGDLLL